MSSNLNQKSRPPVEVVVFEDPRKKAIRRGQLRAQKKQQLDSSKGKGEKKSRDSQQAELARFRHEVLRLGITGLQAEDKQRAMEQLLVKLGAKPSKRAPRNLREVHEEKRLEQEQLEKQDVLAKAAGINLPKRKAKKRKRDNNDVGPLDGQVGSYKPGARILSKDEIRDINSRGRATTGPRKGRGGRRR